MDLPDSTLADTVHAINRTAEHSALGFALSVGAIVIERIYGGDVERWRSKADGTSLRRLCRHPDLRMSASTLYRCLAITEVATRLGGVSTWKHLSVSHFRAVLTLPADDQARLLKTVEREGLSVRALEALVSEEVPATPATPPPARRRGRPPRHPVVKATEQLQRLTRPGGPLRSRDNVQGLPHRTRVELVRSLTEVAATCAALAEELRRG